MFDCHKTHMLHDECYDQLVKFAAKNRKELTCPICRKTVDKAKVVKKQLLEADTNIQVYDPFKVGDEENKVET